MNDMIKIVSHSPLALIREHIKKMSFLWILSKRLGLGGGGSTGIQKCWCLFLFSLIFTIFWTLNGRRGRVDHVPKVLRHFWPKYWKKIFEFWAYTKVTSWLSKIGQHKNYLKYVQNEGEGEGGGGVVAPFGGFPKEKPFFLLCSLGKTTFNSHHISHSLFHCTDSQKFIVYCPI